MDPYDSPPFLGPLHARLSIDARQLKSAPKGHSSHTIKLPSLPPKARLAGFSFGESFAPFEGSTPATWTATVSLGHGTPLLTSGVGKSNPPSSPLPVGQLAAPFYAGQPIGDRSFSLTVGLTGTGLPAKASTKSLTAADLASLATSNLLTIQTDDRAPAVKVTFSAAPATVTDLFDKIRLAVEDDPSVSLDGNKHLVLKSFTTGAKASVSILSGTALSVLGLTVGTVTATSGKAVVTGTTDLLAAKIAAGTDGLGGLLNGLTLSFQTDDSIPFTVTFKNLTGSSIPDDVVDQIRTVTNVDPKVTLSGSVITFTSGSRGSGALLEFGGSAAAVLGLPSFAYGTAGGALPASLTGTADVATVLSTLKTKQLTVTTDAGALSMVTFGNNLTSPTDVVGAILMQTAVDPTMTVGDGITLAYTSGGVRIIDGTALAPLGLTASTGLVPSVTTGVLTAMDFSKLNGTSFSMMTSDRGPFTVTFGTPTGPSDVVATVAAAVNTAISASVDGNDHLVLQTVETGNKASLSVTGNGADALGLTDPHAIYHPGADAPDVTTATAGHVDAHLFYFVERRDL